MQRFHLFYVVPTLLLLAAWMWPLISGQETLYTRDVLSSHYPMKAAQAHALREGELPLIDPYRAGGQPSMGNPNALPLYPDNLLYGIASPLWALNAHFWLHLLIAPFAGAWLGRAWGLRREAAWAAGVCYATSGFFLSLFNLYNLVAGAALAPAFVAACLDRRDERRPPRQRRLLTAAAGILWALLLLAGDPFFAALTLLLAASALVVRSSDAGWPRLPPRGLDAGWLAALVCGTLLAAPMLVEFVRILPLSFRGYWQYSLEAALSQSWDPRSLVEWLWPFFFGRPDFTYWGFRFHGGNPPLFYSLYPGLLCLVLIASSGRPRTRAHTWAWLAAGGGLFFATGAWNPVVRLLYHLPGASALRFPVKMWLAVALGAALLCGLGFERLLAGGRRPGRLLAVLAVIYAAAFALLITLPAPVAEVLRALDPRRLAGELFEAQRLDWAWNGVLSLAVLAIFGAISLLVFRRRPFAGGALLLAAHVATQCFLLQPLYDSDAAEHYRGTPEVLAPALAGTLAGLPDGAVLVHGGQGDLFGKLGGSPLELFPDARFFWLARTHFTQLYPFSGVPGGLHYAFNHAPEGLDSFFTISLARAVRKIPDTARVRVLRASGVDLLLLDRELDPEAAGQVRIEAALPRARTGAPLDLYAYRILDPLAPVQLATRIRRAPHMNAGLAWLTDPELDPRDTVVLPASEDGPGDETRSAAGVRVDVLDETTEALEVRVSSPEGGVLTTRRTFLEIYRATLDGRSAEPVVANLHLLAVEVPPGEHLVRLWVDRRPFVVSSLAALLGLAGLVLLAGRRRG